MGIGNAVQRCGNGKTEKRPRLWDPPVRRYIYMGMGMGMAAEKVWEWETEKRPRLWDPPVRRYMGMGIAEPGMGQPTPYRLNSSKDF
jgi:hypothetical protein